MMLGSDWLDRAGTYLRRSLRAIAVLVDVHWDVAQQEAQREQRRLVNGLVLLGIGVGLLTAAAVLVQVITVLGLRALGLPWLGACAVVAAGNGLVGSGIVAIASRQLRGPYMVQTQARLARTTNMLLQESLPPPGGTPGRPSGP